MSRFCQKKGMTMKQPELKASQEQCLRNQVISPDQPGTVLHDFVVVLDYVGTEGVETQGKYNLLPIKLIGELDGRLSRPLHLHLEIKRPLIRSHPYLQGLNLLLRASGLTRIKGTGPKARLVVDPEMMVQWEQLNPTERYFNLLEAWLRFGRAEMVGERGTLWDGFLFKCLQAWQAIPVKGQRFDLKKPQEIYVSSVGREFYLLALMDLFGIVEVEHPTHPISPWGPAALRHVPFGDALCTLMMTRLHPVWGTYVRELEQDEDEQEDEDGELDGQEEEALELPRIGAWQPIFQPYFPLWRQNLVPPGLESRQGTFVFRVSLGKVWRLIAMPADQTLNDLVHMILRSVNFDNDHLHEFTFRNRLGATVRVKHSVMDEPPYSDEVRIGMLPLESGETMGLIYDFGDNWSFTVRLERIEPPDAKRKAPRIVESHGKARSSMRAGTTEPVRAGPTDGRCK